MKVILVNGSPHERGVTHTALCAVEAGLRQYDIETEHFRLGQKPIQSCTACCTCMDGRGRCVYEDDAVNAFLERAQGADGFVFGSPVHYASASGAMTAFLDRCFFAGGMHFAGKPGAAVCALRRGGATATLDQLNKYMAQARMPVASSLYWNMLHGMSPEEAQTDEEGMQAMRVLGENLGHMLRCFEAGAKAGVKPPSQAEHIFTNFVR